MSLRGAAARFVRRPSTRRDDAVDPESVVADAYRQALGRAPDRKGLSDYLSQVRGGRRGEDVLRELERSPEGAVHAARRHGMALDPRSDADFVSDLYREVLEREADPSGTAWLLQLLADGKSRQSVTFILSTSEESLNKQWSTRMRIQDLRELRPDSFAHRQTVGGGTVEVFVATGPDDLDWMESAILDHGYYEKPGIWSLEADDDKRRMGALLGAFAPRRALEMGCSSGTVLASLAEQGFEAQGLEISRMAIARADPGVRRSIVYGDLLDVDLDAGYDLVFGLDVFEHLNPNRLETYLERLRSLMEPEGYLFVNSPAFGEDPVYGTVFPLDLPSWQADADGGRLFSELLVDEDGYPAHGHLVWAASGWWTDTFAKAGFHRQPHVEHAAHRIYDAAFEAESIARKAFFVFSPAEEPETASAVVERFSRQPVASFA